MEESDPPAASSQATDISNVIIKDPSLSSSVATSSSPPSGCTWNKRGSQPRTTAFSEYSINKKMKVSPDHEEPEPSLVDVVQDETSRDINKDEVTKNMTQETASFVRYSPESCDSDDDFHSVSESLGNRTLSTSVTVLEPPGLDSWLETFHSWTNSERMSALESLVTNEHCDIQQIRFLLTLIEPQLQRDFISLLPKELALYVLSFLDPKDLVKAAQTCRCWRILCEDNLLWRDKCREEGLLEDHETVVDLFRKRISKTRPVKSVLSHSGPVSNGSSPDSSQVPFIASEYKTGFLRQKQIEYNWRFGRFPSESDSSSSGPSTESSGKRKKYLRSILQLKGHDDHVITCLQFNPTSK